MNQSAQRTPQRRNEVESIPLCPPFHPVEYFKTASAQRFREWAVGSAGEYQRISLLGNVEHGGELLNDFCSGLLFVESGD